MEPTPGVLPAGVLSSGRTASNVLIKYFEIVSDLQKVVRFVERVPVHSLCDFQPRVPLKCG